MFVDKVNISVTGGHGGSGCMSFRRERFIPRGGPDGGDGGHGGNVVISSTSNQQSLVPLKYLNHYEGGNGEQGRGNDKHGKNGRDVIIQVPPGTVIRDAGQSGKILADLTEDGAEFVAANGGRGGKGNARFASSVNRCPRNCEPGMEGEQRLLEVELKIVADIGLVGFPNAGKSTYLAAVSNAKPKAAAYPFTTRNPQVGIVNFGDYYRMSIADIPGLLEGAHQNVGLGHEFLRHIERTKVLAYMLDMTGREGKEPLAQFDALQNELERYQAGLTKRPSIILANKMDEDSSVANLKQLEKKVPYEICPISALLQENVDGSIKRMRSLLIGDADSR